MNTRNLVIAGSIAIAGLVAFRPAQQAILEMIKPAPIEQNVMGVLYQQRAAEYRALCLQAYNIGAMRVEAAVHNHKRNSPKLAVITDLDETALDNSGYAVRCYNEGHMYTPDSWKKWCDDAKAEAVPGAVAFFQYADKNGVDIYYISNREENVLETTMNNMKRLGFPQVSREHFMFKVNKDSSSKTTRRAAVGKDHTIVALFGDNLTDMDGIFDDADETKRNATTNDIQKIWGDKYIVIPNATYGDWENALYADYKKKTGKSPDMDNKYLIRRNALINY